MVYDRVQEMFEFFQKEEILDAEWTLYFGEEPTSCRFKSKEIYINPRQCMDGDELEYMRITAGEFSNLFSPLEIHFFHELGHFCDFKYRLKYDKEPVMKMLAERTQILRMQRKQAKKTMKRYGKANVFEALENVACKLEAHFYRSLPLEVEADENAKLLMRYYLDSHTSHPSLG